LFLRALLVHDDFHILSCMSAFRPRDDLFSDGQDAHISLLVADEIGGTAGEGALSILIPSTSVPDYPQWLLARPPPNLELVKAIQDA